MSAKILGAGAVLVLLSALFLNSGKSVQTTKGRDVQLLDIRNSAVNLSEFKGKVIFVNNWASWCPPCVAEMSSIQNLKNELSEKDFAFVMVSYDEDRDKAISFMKKRGYNFNIYFPGDNYPYASESIPTSYIINKSGRLVTTFSGMHDFNKKEAIDLMKSVAGGI